MRIKINYLNKYSQEIEVLRKNKDISVIINYILKIMHKIRNSYTF